MNWLRNFQRRFRAVLRKEELDARMDAEMRSHIEMQTQENMETGMKPEEARYNALRQFGWVESMKETCRDQRGLPWLEILWQDIRYGVRQLRKNPGFTTVAVLTLALGIAANTAIFSVVNALLLQPLPYTDSDRLVMLSPKGTDVEVGNADFTTFVDWRERSRSFERMALITSWGGVLTGQGEPERVEGLRVSADYFRLLGVTPMLGRDFTPEEDRPDTWFVAMLSHDLWQRRFNSDANIKIGRAHV